MLSLVKYFLIWQLLFASVVIHAQERIALVIGNADYQSSALDNSVNDAIDIAKTLQDLNFQVTLVTDKNKTQMQSAIAEFGGKLNKDTVGLFYYSGHAVQYQGVNYLIPIDSMKQVNNAEDLPDSAIASSSILSKLEDSQSKLNFVFLDSCRDNPYTNLIGEITPGLAKSSAVDESDLEQFDGLDEEIYKTRGITKKKLKLKKETKGTLVAYSTMPGKVAADGGVGRNSPYTKSLLKHIVEPNIPIQIMLSDVMQSVESETGGRQIPIYETTISGKFCFNPVDNQCGKSGFIDSFLKGVKNVKKMSHVSKKRGPYTYIGQFKNGKPHGKGVKIFASGMRVEGVFKNGPLGGKGVATYPDGKRMVISSILNNKKRDKNGHRIVHYKAVAYYPDGKRAEGVFTNGKLDGEGLRVYPNGKRVEGIFKNDKLNGEGLKVFADGSRWEGMFKDGRLEGDGLIIYADGSRSEGVFKADKLNGDGLKVSINSRREEGFFKDGKLHGEGLKVFPEGKRHEGMFKNNKLNGKGVKIFPSGMRRAGTFKDNKEVGKTHKTTPDDFKKIILNSKKHGEIHYHGQLEDGKPHGRGIKRFANGMKHEGVFKHGKLNGKGLKKHADGRRVLGAFKDNKLNGKGVKKYPNGKQVSGVFKDNKLIKGLIEFPDGKRLIGVFKGYKLNGKGLIIYSDGRVEQGVFKNNILGGK